MLVKSLIVFLGLCSLALSAPLVEEQRFSLNPRAGFCTSLFGVNGYNLNFFILNKIINNFFYLVCLDVSGVNGQLNLKLTVGGVTLFNQGIVGKF